MKDSNSVSTRKISGALLVATAGCLAGGALLAGRSFIRRLTRENQALTEAKLTLGNRNKQLDALYSVFSEITETLSLSHVVNAALRETMQLMSAHGAVIWLLKEKQLVPVGSLTSEGKSIRGIEARPLGDGLLDRTVKRGRTIKIDDSNQSLLSDVQRGQGLKSGIMVPLIIAGRVVGLLNCWSVIPNAFSDDDVRMVEMLSSQVAAAIAAAETNETSQMRAQQDPLTGIPNRRQLAEDIERESALAIIGNRRTVVAMADIDHFKRINDDFGHRVGDAVLQRIAALLQRAIRGNDALYRYGGEEFLLVFNDVGLEEAKVLAERLRATLERETASLEQKSPPVTISIGLAAQPDHGATLESLIDLADRAMYEAKREGRNRVVSWNDSLNDVAVQPAA